MIFYSDRFLRIISPFMGIKGIAIFPFIILKELYKTRWRSEMQKNILINHESIHIRQQMDLIPFSFALNSFTFLYFFDNYWLLLLNILPFINSSVFYLIYVIEFIFKGYEGISFEREANENELDNEYLENRKFLEFSNYI